LAEALSDLQQPDLALQELERVKLAYDASFGPLDPDQVELLETRAQILRVAGRNVESASNCHAALALRARLKASAPEFVPGNRRCAALAAIPVSKQLRFR